MIYAYDKAAAIPLVDVYDRQMMLAEIGAAKDMYEKGIQEIKDFRKDYGDLMFLNKAYQDWYNNNFNVGGFISDLYKQGIDPVRSAEGRSLVNQYINSRKYGDLAQRRQWDANMRAYNESKARLGTAYDPEFEKFLLGGNPDEWGDKAFTATSATPYVSLRDMVHPTFAAIKPHMLSTDEVNRRGYDPNYDYIGVTENDMRSAMGELAPGIRNSTNYKYQRYLAEQDLINEGNFNPTDNEIDNKLIENAIISDAGIMTPLQREEKAEYKRARDFYWDNRLDAAKTARDLEYQKELRKNTPGFDEKGNAIKGYNELKEVPSIFRTVDAAGEGRYITEESPEYLWIRPIGKGILTIKDKDTGTYIYRIPKNSGAKIYISGTNRPADIGDCYFDQSGYMYKKEINNITHYFITGTVFTKVTDEDGVETDEVNVDNTGNEQLYDMEVTEQDYSYGKKQSQSYKPTP